MAQRTSSSTSDEIQSQASNTIKRDKIELDAPLWRYVTRASGAKTMGGGNRTWTRNFCKKLFNGSYSRVKAHLLKISGVGIQSCSKVDLILKEELEKEQFEAQVMKEQQRRAPLNIPLPPMDDGFQKDRLSNHSS